MHFWKKIFGRLSSEHNTLDTSATLRRSTAVLLADEIERLTPGQSEYMLSLLRDGLKEDKAEDARYRAAEALVAVIYPKYKFSEYARIFLEDEEFIRYYERFMDAGNWHSLDRKYTLAQLLKLVSHLHGDLVECGTHKGASAFLMCHANCGNNRIIHLFDSFEGLSAPGQFDGDYWLAGSLRVQENDIIENLAEFNNYRIYKGWIPKRFEEIGDLEF